MRCPWLTRTAGRPIYKPGAWAIITARLRFAIMDSLVPGLGAVASAAAQMAPAFARLGQVLGNSGLVPWPPPEGESTARKTG